MSGSMEKVVDLMAYRGAPAQPAEFLQMEGYWQALRGPGGSLPERARFDPRGIADLLGTTLLLERISRGEARIRLAGMALHDLMGMELRGMPLSALAVPESRAALGDRLEQLFEAPAIARLEFSGESGFACPPFGAKLLLLPMIGPTGAVDRALGALIGSGVVGRRPRRLVLQAARIEPIPAPPAGTRPQPDERQARPGLPAATETQPQPAEFAEAPPAFGHAAPGRAPHLRLVKG